MRTGPSRLRARALAPLLCIVGFLAAAAPASAVSGASFTTINSTADGGGTGAGQGLCFNGNGNVNCNQYFDKDFVWINGGPTGNSLTDGQYFFAVLVPSGQSNPNDRVPNSLSDSNLSDDYDTYQNRTFTVSGGNISFYGGTHDQGIDTADDNELKIRLMPYSNTSNNGGVYILAICSLEGAGASPNKGVPGVNPKDCKYDAFKIREDEKPPECPRPTFSYNAFGQRVGTQLFRDSGGIDKIEILNVTNATVAPLENFFQGTVQTVKLTATKISEAFGARIEILVTDVAGNSIRCDPVLTTLRRGAFRQTFRHLTQREGVVTLKNGRPGIKTLVVTVNGKRFVARGLRAGQRLKLNIRSALRPGRNNRVTLSGRGPRNARADLAISN